MRKSTRKPQADPITIGAHDNPSSFVDGIARSVAADTQRSPHLLVVEADPGASFVMIAALNFGGFTSDVVASAVEALRRMGEVQYDLILMELSLPDLGGEQLIKTLQFHSEVPIIIVSGEAGEQDKVAGLDAGADDFVAKPYSPNELLARVRTVLRRTRQSGQKTRDHDVFAPQHQPIVAKLGNDLHLVEQHVPTVPS